MSRPEAFYLAASATRLRDHAGVEPSQGSVEAFAQSPGWRATVDRIAEMAAAAERLRLVGTDEEHGVLDRYEVRAVVGTDGASALVTYYCGRVHAGTGGKAGHVGVIARDLDGDQTGLTLGELAQSALEHEDEHHAVKRTGYVNRLVHLNRSDPRDPATPFCGCHDDPWALCPRWEQWGITPGERAAAEARAAAWQEHEAAGGTWDDQFASAPPTGEGVTSA